MRPLERVLVSSLLVVLLVPVGTTGLDGSADPARPQPLEGSVLPALPTLAQATEEEVGPFRFRCPDTPTPQDVRLERDDTRVFAGCPIRVEDGGDHLGGIHLAVHPGNHQQLAFFSLHGTPAGDGPSPRSRVGQTHTTFTSPSGGTAWNDQPHPRVVAAYGEHATGTIDMAGNTYAGYLWAVEHGSATRSSFALYKGGPVTEPYGMSAAYEYPWVAEHRDEKRIIERLDMVRIPAFDPERVPHQGTNESAGSPREGDIAADRGPTPETILTTWHTRVPNGTTSTTGHRGWIDAAWTDTTGDNEWTMLPVEEVIGPCNGTSPPVAYRGKALVACVVAAGYDHRPRARIGDIDVWSIDPFDAETEWMGSTGIKGEHPLLAGTPDGYFVATAQRLEGPQDMRVQTAFGWFGTSWTSGTALGRTDIGPELHRAAGLRPIIDAHVTGLAVSQKERTVFLIYTEWNEPEEPDANDLAAGEPPEDDIQKLMVAFNECSWLGGLRMELNADTLPTSTALGAEPRGMAGPGTFADLQDGLVYTTIPSTGEELAHFAINDHGIAQVGAAVVAATGSPCVVAAPIVPPPAVPIAQALSIGTGTTVAVGSTIGVLASLMVGYLLTIKRRTAQSVAAEDR